MAVKTVKRVRKVVAEEAIVPEVTLKENEVKVVGSRFKIYVGAVLGLVVLGLVVSYKTNHFPIVAMVGMTPITRFEVNNELFKQGGKALVDNLVTERIVKDEIERLGIKVTKEEINSKIETIKSGLPEGQDLTKILADRGMTMADVEKQLTLQMGVEKAVADKTKVTDEEVTKFLTENGAQMSATTEAGKKEEATLALQQQKTQSAISTWVQDLRTKAKIWYSDPSLKSL